MKIHCNSPEAIIHSCEASDFFEKIILELEIENKEYLFSLFKRVKAIEKVSDDELNFLYDFLTSIDFKRIYKEKISTFTGNKEKLKNLEYSTMISSFISFMNKSKVIYILDLGADELSYEGKKYLKVNIGKKRKIQNKNIKGKIDLEGDNDNFEKFRNRGKKEVIEKYKYIEFVEENNDYLIGIDLRSGLYNLIEKNTNRIVLKTKEKLFFKRNNNSYCFVENEENLLFLVIGNSFININETTTIHSIGNELFIIDKKLNTVTKIGGKMNILGEGQIQEINGNTITFLNTENKIILKYNIKTSTFEKEEEQKN